MNILQAAIPFTTDDAIDDFSFTKYYNASAYSESWLEERDSLFHDRGIWTRLSSSKLLFPYFINSRNQNVKSNKRVIPVDLEARVIEIENPDIHTSLWNKNAAVLGYRNNIFRFWDDPLCDSYIFPNGLYVCGDARVKGTITVVSGVNVSAIIDQRFDEPRETHVHSRCTINPSKKLSPNSPWCFLSFTARQADLYVLNSFEVSGTLYAKVLRVEGGSKALIGLRGLIYTSMRYTGNKFTNFIMDYLYKETIVDKNRLTVNNRNKKADSNVQNSTNSQKPTPSLYHERLTMKEYFELEKRQKEEFERFIPQVQNILNEHQDADTSKPTSMPSRLHKFEQVSLTMEDIQSLKCPLIDLSGTIVILQKTANGTIVRQTEFSHDSEFRDDYRYNPNLSQQHILKSSDFKQLTTNAYNSNMEDSHLFENSLFGKELPAYPHNVTLGDLNTLGVVTIKDASFLWVYGNFIGPAAFIDSSSDFHLHCGHFFTNVSHPLGLTAIKASAFTSGGLMESVASKLIAQTSSDFLIAGSAILTKFVQIFKASHTHIAGELLTGFVSVNKGSNFTVASMVEVESLMDISEKSSATLFGSFRVGSLQVLNVSKFNLYTPPLDKNYTEKNLTSVAIVENSLFVDANSEAEFLETSLFVRQSIHVSNRSRVYIFDGDLELEGDGFVRVHGSDVFVGKNLVASKGSILATSGSTLLIKGSLRVSGKTAKEAKEEAEQLKKNKASDSGYKIVQDPITEKSTWKEPKHKVDSINLKSIPADQATINQTNNRTSNSDFSKESFESSDKKNEDEEIVLARPSLFLDSSMMYVSGVIENVNSWVDIANGSNLTIGLGLFSLSSDTTLTRVRDTSLITVHQGPLFPGAGLLITERSKVLLEDGSVIAAGTIDLTDKSELIAKDVRAVDAVSLHGLSHLNVSNVFIVDGEALHVSSRSRVTCGELRQIGGYIFVEDGARLSVLNGTLWVLGSIVAQDRGVVTVKNGNLVAIKGDIVVENFSEIFVDKENIVLYSAYVNSLLSQNEDLENFDLPAIENFDLSTLSEGEISKNFISRTTESIIHGPNIVPHTSEINVYVQAVPRLIINPLYNQSAIPEISKETPEKLQSSLNKPTESSKDSPKNEWSTINTSRQAIALGEFNSNGT